MNEPQDLNNPNSQTPNTSSIPSSQTPINPEANQASTENSSPTNPGQISPSFNPRANQTEEPTPQVVPKGKFIEGYNFKFLIVIILVISSVFGIMYFRNSSFSEMVKAAADSIKSGLFKTTTSDITGSKSESSSQTLTSATSSQKNSTTNNQSTTYDNYYSPAPGSSSVSQPGTTYTQTPSQNTTATAAPSCIGENELVYDNSTNTTLGTCCDGLTPKSYTSTLSGGISESQPGSGLYCQP